VSGILGFQTTGRTTTLPDGREMDDGELLIDEDSHKRIRLGYQCGRCMEVFVSCWPDHCRLCGFPVGTVQREYYEREYTGSRVIRTTLTQEELADGEARLHELLQARRR
jgi:hypothetical protein